MAAQPSVVLTPRLGEPGRGRPLLSVIIVTWNVREFALRCLGSLYRSAGTLPTEVFVVDNASSDGTVEEVRRRFKDVVVLANARNVGFPIANNQAFRQARGEYVLFLNPDTELREDTLEACLAVLEREPDVGMVGCKLMYPDGRVQYEGARNPYLLRHLAAEVLYLHKLFPRHRIFGHHLLGDWDHEGDRDVEAISGAFMMVRRSIAHQLGGLPEEVFMYHEDLAFCLRVRRAGWRIRYVGRVSTTHFGTQSSKKSHLRLELLEGEHKLRLIREAQGRGAAVVGRILFALRSLLRLAVCVLTAPWPWRRSLDARFPGAFNANAHLVCLVWSVAPRAVRRLVPSKVADLVKEDESGVVPSSSAAHLQPGPRAMERLLDEVAGAFPEGLRRRGFNRNYSEYRLRLRLLRPLLPRCREVLDLGAGAAVTSMVLRRLGCRVVVLDTWEEYAQDHDNQMGSSSAMLERFRRFSLQPVMCDLLQGPLPFHDASFDLVTLYDVIEHLPRSPRMLLEEIHRVLRPGGFLILTTPNLANLRARVRLLLGRTVHFPIHDWYDQARFYGHIREFTPAELRYMLRRAGFAPRVVRLSNSPQWNTRLRNGEWHPRLLLSSPFQVAKFLYFLFTGLVPSFRYGTHVVAARVP